MRAAKTWYETSFPRTNTAAQVKTNSADGSTLDLTQLINPDWSKANDYNRYGQDVVETPVDPSGRLELKNSANQTQSYSRSSYIILKDDQNYQAYIMTIVVMQII